MEASQLVLTNFEQVYKPCLRFNQDALVFYRMKRHVRPEKDQSILVEMLARFLNSFDIIKCYQCPRHTPRMLHVVYVTLRHT